MLFRSDVVSFDGAVMSGLAPVKLMKAQPAGTVATGEKVETADQDVKNPCAACRKTIGPLGFACRCDGMYSGMRRHAGVHD